MSESVPNGPELSGEGDGAEKREANPGDLLGDIECFSRLSSELKDCLSGITRKIIHSLNELKSVREALARKKKELKDLYAVEESAAALKDLQEEHRLKQSEFESAMENRRRQWAEEKALKEKEDEEYRQTLQLRRQREEEEFRQKLAREQSENRQKLEEELGRTRQQDIERQALLNRDLVKREQALKEKELEWVRLIQELELFMTGLVERTRKKNAAPEVAARGRNDIAPIRGDDAFHGSAASLDAPDGDEKTKMDDEPDDGETPSVATVREMLLSQERRIETIQTDLEDAREPVPFRLRPKDNA